MANKRFEKSSEMEERDPTPDEVAAVAGQLGVTNAAPPPLAPYRGDREEDQPDREAPPPAVMAAQQAATAAGVTPVTVEDINARMLKALESIEARAKSDGGGSELLALAMIQLSEGLKGIKEGQLQAAQIIANMQRATTSPENKFVPDISAYNPRGEKDFPRPQLRCEYLMPWPIKPGAAEELTREEIELLNLLQAGDHTVKRADGSKIKVQVAVITKYDSDEPSRVILTHETAFNNDHQRLMPHDWIRQLVQNNPKTSMAAKAVLTMEEEEALILARRFNDGREALAGELVVSVGA